MGWFRIFAFRYWPQVAALLLLLLGYGLYRYFAYYDTHSSDAYVSANVINITPLVSGSITKVFIKDNQSVKKGDKLIEIDPLPYIYAMQQAKAKLNTIKAKHADVNEVLAAQAELDQANYLLGNTTIIAPENGYVTNFNVHVGQYANTGEGLFALIESKQWWVITRYRETALRLIKLGDKAKITLDMYPGKVFHGHVSSIGWGINRVQTGNVASSTLIYIEATENWIKISQRFPVQIDIDDATDEYPLRVGASATTTTYR